MAFSLVQEIGTVNGADGGVGSTCAWTGSKAVTAGDTIMFWLACDTSVNVVTIADSLGLSWVAIFDSVAEDSTHNIRVHWYAALVGADDTITSLTVTHSSSFLRELAIAEFVGVLPNLSVDGSAHGNSTSAAVASVAGSGAHFFVAAADYPSTTTATLTWTQPAGYTKTFATAPASLTNGAVASNRVLYIAHLDGDPTGTITGTLSGSPVTPNWVAASALLLSPVVRPALAGISMDGVTVR